MDFENLLDDDDKATEIGNEIIRILGLKVKKNGRVDTTHGDKTPCGLARTLLHQFKPPIFPSPEKWDKQIQSES